jgi:hypothetical protein
MADPLTLLTWPDYLSPLTLEQFQREFGAAVAVDIVPSAVELVERMRAPGPTLPFILCPPCCKNWNPAYH